MNISLGTRSIALFAISVIFLLLFTLFDSSLAVLSLTVERIVSALFLVLPALLGVILGVMSLVRKESKPWVAILGILSNALFALFHLFVLSFAG